MKLLFLAHRIPFPPNKGDKIRSYHELRAFTERGYEVHLLAFADELRDLSYQVDLARICASVEIVPLHRQTATLRALTNLIVREPLSLGYFASRKMKRLVKRAVAGQDFDAVFVYSSAMAQYAPHELSARTIIDLVDTDSEKWRDYARRKRPPQSWVYELEWQRLRKYEHDIAQRFVYTILTTQREASLLDGLDEFTRHARLRVIANGVELDHYQPDAGASSPSPPRLVFVGAMDYYANVDGVRWFAQEILPLIRASEPGVEFFIVGGNPTREVKRLAEIGGVTVTGFVDEIRPYLQCATACVIPLRVARGIQNKALEAMAAGKAIIATPESVAGLQVEDGVHLLLAQTPRDFAEATIRVIREASLRERLGERSRLYVETLHNWEPLLQRLVELVESVAVKRSDNSSPGPKAMAHKGF
jgi:sugar transferase (PEP-CTERM/EpsH1 system associated)